MPEQRHIIKRQMIELEVRGAGQAPVLQAEVSRIYRRRIIPLIDECCSELSAPDRLHRIESLHLDIGTLDPRNFEEQLVAKVNAALRRELAAQIYTQEEASTRPGQNPKAQSQLELFTFFVRTGTLPWWADTSQADLLAENLKLLLQETPELLRQQLQELVPAQPLRQRMINQYTDEQLANLSSLLVPDFTSSIIRDVPELRSLLKKTRAAAGRQPSWLRAALWGNVLQVAASGNQHYATLEAFYLAVLKRVALELGSPADTLIAELWRVAQKARTGQTGPLTAVLEKLAQPQPGTIPAAAKKEKGALDRRLARLQPAGASLSVAWDELRAFARRLPAATQSAWLAALETSPSPTGDMQAVIRRILELLESEELPRQGLPVGEISRLAATLRTTLDEESESGSVLRMQPAARAGKEEDGPQTETEVDLRFSDADEVSVSNAGLVILWPFLVHFFAHLGLLDEENRQFKDPAARQRGVGLLQVIATQDASPLEYLLPLNKLLCGLPLGDVFDFGAELLEAEAQECTTLLEAVIAQAPILHDMSVAGFRSTFLLRPGLLSARDGLWLLRVERETFDVILERFPWSWEWVKLPWMETPLRVEW